MRTFRVCFLPALAAMLCASPAAAFQKDFDDSNSELRPVIERFASDRGNLLRTYNIDGSAARRARVTRFYTEWRDRLSKMNFDSLSQDGRVDYLAFRNLLQHELARLELDAQSEASVTPYLPFSSLIVGLEEKRRSLEPVNPEDTARALVTLHKTIDEARRQVEAKLRANADAGELRTRRIAGNRAVARAAALRSTLRSWFTFYNGYDPAFTWWNEEAYRTADTALQGYTAFLRERVAGLRPAPAEADSVRTPAGPRGSAGAQAAAIARPGETDDIVGNPVGRDGLMNELAYEMIPYTPEELIAIAEKEFAWCENEMKRASREMGFGDEWKNALEKVKTLHTDPGKQPELVRDLAREAIRFLDEHDLVTIPDLARETWRMEMMSPERQLLNPFFLGGETIIVSYPTNSMTFEQKMMAMRGNNIPFSRATVFHELIPGHHLQGFMANRFKPYRSVVGGTPFITEGWSLYWELLFYEMKFQKTPEDRVGALFWRMHRCARIIFSLNFHLGRMTPDECINFLVERVGHERENAVGEVRRSFAGDYGPLYQAAYLLGGMQLYALHRELVGSGRMTNRQFHDAVLRENRIPVELIRAAMTKQKLSRDTIASWKFAAGR